MKVLIIEDEKSAARNLKYLLKDIDDSVEVETVLETVTEAIKYFKGKGDAELVFMDIHLADGISFEIFEKTEIKIPIIFTTAYDEYAVKAFKVNSIDYLLKPIDEDELKNAIKKYKSKNQFQPDYNEIQQLLSLIKGDKKSYKNTYLVQQRDTLFPLKILNVAYFKIEEGIVKAYTSGNKIHTIDKSLEEIESEINPEHFFRVNRQFIVNRNAIDNLKLYFNGKLILNVFPITQDQIIISKPKAPIFKKWMNNNF